MAFDVPPVTVSPIINLFWDEIKSLELSLISSTRITAVALDESPVIVSAFTKAPIVVSSKRIVSCCPGRYLLVS